MRTIINHKWQCQCGAWIGENYDECPFCQRVEMVKNIKQKQEIKKYRIKNECASCGKEFNNSPKYYLERGNYCPNCCEKIEKKQQWRKLRTKQSRNRKQEKKFQELTEILLRKWGLDMEEDNKKFQGFENYLWKVFQLDD